MANCTLRCFGVGDGWPCGDRFHSSFLYQIGASSILIDCGEPLSTSYKASGLGYDLIDRIFISHLHSDHVGGFFMFMQGMWLEKRQKPLPISMPEEGLEPIQRMLRLSTIYPELLEFDMLFEPIQPLQPVKVGGARVTLFPTTHLDKMRQVFGAKYGVRLDSYSFLLEGAALRIVHSADIGKPEDLEPLLQGRVDVLVCEIAHFTPEALFTFLHGRDIKRIIFVHVGRAYWENMPSLRSLAAAMLPHIPHSFAGDNEQFEL